MNPVNNANLLNLMLNLGNLTDAAVPSLAIDTALPLPQGVDLEGLSPELLEQLAGGEDGIDFQWLMQQGLQPGEVQEGLSESDLQAAIRLDFRVLDKGDAELEEAPSQALPNVAADAIEARLDDLETEENVVDAAPVLASPVILEESVVQPARPTRQGMASASILSSGTDRSLRQAAVAGGASLPQQGQDASGPSMKAPLSEGGESFILDETFGAAASKNGNAADTLASAAGALPGRKDGLEARFDPSAVEGRAPKGEAKAGDTPMDEDALLMNRNGDPEERSSRLEGRTPVSAEVSRGEAPTPARVEAQVQQSPVVTTAADKAVDMASKGMNDLPAEMKTLHLSPRAGEAAWGREMGDRIGFLLHNNLKQAEIRLDPPHLGKLDIQLQVQDDKAIVNIHAQTAQTRDLIDASLMRLRDALQDAGYSQVDVNVSQRDHSMAQGEGGGSGQGGSAASTGADSLDGEALPAGMSRHEIELTARMQGRIDYFA